MAISGIEIITAITVTPMDIQKLEVTRNRLPEK